MTGRGMKVSILVANSVTSTPLLLSMPHIASSPGGVRSAFKVSQLSLYLYVAPRVIAGIQDCLKSPSWIAWTLAVKL